MTYRKPLHKRGASASVAPDELPADFVPPDELPADFQVAPSITFAPQPMAQTADEQTRETSWIEAAFPRTSEALSRGEPWYSPRVGVSSILDQASLPFRAGAAGVQQIAGAVGGGGGPTIREDLARRGGSEPGFIGGVEEAVRSPANAVLPLAASVRVPAWLAAQAPGWLRGSKAAADIARGVAQGLGGGSAIGASRVSEDVASGSPIDAGRAIADVAAGTVTGGALGALAPFGRGMQSFGGKWMTTVIKPTDKARAAGWNPMSLMAELSKDGSGYIPMTLGGLRRAAQSEIDRRAAGRMAAIAADETAALARGVVPRVNLREAANAGAQALENAVASQELTGAVRSAPGAADWLTRELQVLPSTPSAPQVFLDKPAPVLLTDYTPIQNALNARRGIDEFAFVPNAKGVSAAREVAAKAARKNINQQLDVIAPRTREVDASLAPLMANAEGLGIVGERRLNNAFISPTDAIMGSVAGGASGSLPSGIAAALLMRTLRSPAPASALYMGGRGAQTLARRRAGMTLGELLQLEQAASDNARGL